MSWVETHLLGCSDLWRDAHLLALAVRPGFPPRALLRFPVDEGNGCLTGGNRTRPWAVRNSLVSAATWLSEMFVQAVGT